jgi:hypothetical protein
MKPRLLLFLPAVWVAWCASAQAQDSQLVGVAHSTGARFGINEWDDDYGQFAFFGSNDPGVSQTHLRDTSIYLSDTTQAAARIFAGMGVIKASVSASVPRPAPNFDGGQSNGYASATFMDSISVNAPGVAAGTPVTYWVNFRIEGRMSSGTSVSTITYAQASALVRLEDANNSSLSSVFEWAPQQGYGVHTLAIGTTAGATLRLTGNLSLTAHANSNAPPAQPVAAFADFGNSAYFNLGTSVPGFNTVGASGHDFASPVPEPQIWALFAAGLLWLGRRSLSLSASGERA